MNERNSCGLTLYRVEARTGTVMRMVPGSIKAGFPSPAADYMEEDIDLVRLLGMDRPSVFVARVDGDSMADAHIPNRSYLVIDRSLRPQQHDVVVAVLNGEFTVKTLVKTPNSVLLYPESKFYEPVVVREFDQFEIWGVVAQVVIDRMEFRGRR